MLIIVLVYFIIWPICYPIIKKQKQQMYSTACQMTYMSLMSDVFGFRQGMGGQHEYFGLWIDSNFGKGHSKAKPRCTTYNSPQLSAKEDFTIDTLEVWALGELPEHLQVGRKNPQEIQLHTSAASTMSLPCDLCLTFICGNLILGTARQLAFSEESKPRLPI